MFRNAVFLKVVMPILAAILFAIAFGIIYPLGWPEQAKKHDDPIGYWIGTIGIPLVFVVTCVAGHLIHKRSTSREHDGNV